MTAIRPHRTHRWAVARLAYPLAESTVEGWRGTPAAVRAGWLRRVGIGLVVLLLVSWALAVGARALAGAGRLDWEAGLLRQLDAGLVPMSYHSAVWLGAFGSSAMLVPVAFVAAFLLVLRGRVLPALSVLLAFFGSKPIVLLGWAVWDRARPDFIANAAAVPVGLQSFPSGHVAQIVAVYGLLTWMWAHLSRSAAERLLAWTLLAFFVVVNSVARLRIGAHWPSDVVAGLVLGIGWMVALAWALRRAEERSANG